MDKTKQALLPAYVIAGEDELKQQTAIKRLRARFEEEGSLDFNFDSFTATESSAEEILGAANTLPFGLGMRLVEVKDAQKLKTKDLKQICEYLANPNPQTVICFIAPKLPSNHKLIAAVQALGPKAYIDCSPQKRRDLQNSLQKMARFQGISLTPGAASTLIDICGTNTITLDTELKKIALAHRGSDEVNESEVLSLVARTVEPKPWELVDAFSSRNMDRTIQLLHAIEKTSPYSLLSMCVTRIREILTAKALKKRNASGQLASVLGLPAWRVKNHYTWAGQYSSQELITALETARNTEFAMKTDADPDAAFLDWLLNTLKRT